MFTLVSFRRSPKSKLPREVVELNCAMSEEDAINWIHKCGYKKACEFSFGHHDNIKRYEGSTVIECSPDWDGQPG